MIQSTGNVDTFALNIKNEVIGGALKLCWQLEGLDGLTYNRWTVYHYPPSGLLDSIGNLKLKAEVSLEDGLSLPTDTVL